MGLQHNPKISLVGAGPGDPDLITLKGIRCLRSADVVLYDALANPALLEWAPASALCLPVGKRAGKHGRRQDEINLHCVQYALKYGHVVRLKGGDPFVFGRGHEELSYAQAMGIPCEVVPGISSCIAVPELEQVPLTRRGVSESFWVITGTTRSGELSGDLALAAQSTATVVILMGLRKIREIMALFRAAGKEDRPVMVIRRGSLPDSNCLIGTVNTMAEQLAAAPGQGPGLIVVGEVVGLHPSAPDTIKTKAYVAA